ncbi:hypothetical protein GWK47_030410 [Chionoecetes opilio]|uniref:Uncharacterized protein n=1 Tax=Chionoecetes opilio TaxID=41210 RepID=A0A8J4YK26_CHIOP|nr:hypothetical protein GWK47_030410 [Chionoecetes opilio]
MAVMAYSAGIQKILGVPKLSDGKAEPTAVVIGEVLTEWNLKDRIVVVCFVTTAVNTGGKSGVCLRLEMMPHKPLLYFVCRHHPLEILLDKVFSSLFKEQSKGPEVSLFLDFRNMWPQIDQTKYSTAMNDKTIMLRVQSWYEEIIQLSQAFLQQTASPRLSLTLIKELASHTNQAIRDAATKAFSRHLWYLSEVTVGLALFDEEVSIMEKREMVHRISTVKGLEKPSPLLHLTTEDVVSKNLSKFFTSTTKKLLQHLDIDLSFLGTDPVTWATTEAYARGKERVTKLLVTNEVAECGVAAIQEFTKNGRTKQEDQLDC